MAPRKLPYNNRVALACMKCYGQNCLALLFNKTTKTLTKNRRRAQTLPKKRLACILQLPRPRLLGFSWSVTSIATGGALATQSLVSAEREVGFRDVVPLDGVAPFLGANALNLLASIFLLHLRCSVLRIRSHTCHNRAMVQDWPR